MFHDIIRSDWGIMSINYWYEVYLGAPYAKELKTCTLRCQNSLLNMEIIFIDCWNARMLLIELHEHKLRTSISILLDCPHFDMIEVEKNTAIQFDIINWIMKKH